MKKIIKFNLTEKGSTALFLDILFVAFGICLLLAGLSDSRQALASLVNAFTK